MAGLVAAGTLLQPGPVAGFGASSHHLPLHTSACCWYHTQPSSPCALFWVQGTILRGESSLPASAVAELQAAKLGAAWPWRRAVGWGSAARIAAGTPQLGRCPPALQVRLPVCALRQLLTQHRLGAAAERHFASFSSGQWLRSPRRPEEPARVSLRNARAAGRAVQISAGRYRPNRTEKRSSLQIHSLCRMEGCRTCSLNAVQALRQPLPSARSEGCAALLPTLVSPSCCSGQPRPLPLILAGLSAAGGSFLPSKRGLGNSRSFW